MDLDFNIKETTTTMKETINKFFADIIVLVLAFVSPLVPVLLLTFGLVIGDLITGILKAKKLNQKIQSRRMGNTISKLALYFLVIILGSGIMELLTPDIPVVHGILGIITLVEIKSMDENIKIILGYSIWKKLLGALSRKENDEE